MKEYILIWYIRDFPENGGGREYALFKNILEVEEKVNELTKDEKITISFCGHLKDEITFKAVEKITRWEADL